MEEKIMQNLLLLNFNLASKGFKYWINAIEYVQDFEIEFTNMEEIYVHISKIHNVTKGSVERAMRHCSKDAHENIRIYFKYKGKISQKTILELLLLMNNKEE